MNQYSIINDFGGQEPNLNQLYKEISDSSITETLESVSRYLDDVEIIFNNSLSTGEKTILDSLITNHVPDFTPITVKSIILVNEKTFKSKSYKRAITTTFPGTTYARAESISWIDNQNSSYDIMIYDKTNKTILLETTLTNNTENIQELGELNNLSTEPSQIEVLIKRNGNSAKIYFENIVIHYV